MQTRRHLLVTGTLLAVDFGATISPFHRAFGQAMPPTPACSEGDHPTPRQTAGPYFKPHSPERADLIDASVGGQVMELSGAVTTQLCRPVARALIDVWQADSEGRYDLKGFRLRGHFFTGADGRYTLRTIVPGLYPGRTRHVHVRVQAPGQPVVTTQLYFPGERGNRADGLYRRELEISVESTGDRLAGHFDFVLDQS